VHELAELAAKAACKRESKYTALSVSLALASHGVQVPPPLVDRLEDVAASGYFRGLHDSWLQDTLWCMASVNAATPPVRWL